MSKPPAFQFYPRDWLSDASVRLMGPAGKGLYIDLLSIQWLEGSIPSDMDEIALLVGYSIDTIWPKVESRFKGRRDGRVYNRRMDMQRKEYEEIREKKVKAGVESARIRAEQAAKVRNDSTRVGDVLQQNGNPSSSTASASSTATATTTSTDSVRLDDVDSIVAIVNDHRESIGMTALRGGNESGRRYIRARIKEHDLETVAAVARHAPLDPWIEEDANRLNLQPIFSPKSFPMILDRMANGGPPKYSAADIRLFRHRQRMEEVDLR